MTATQYTQQLTSAGATRQGLYKLAEDALLDQDISNQEAVRILNIFDFCMKVLDAAEMRSDDADAEEGSPGLAQGRG